MTLERVRCDIESRSESYTASETQIVTLLCDPAASFFYHLKAVEPRCIMIAAVPQQTEQFVAECFLFFPLFFFFFSSADPQDNKSRIILSSDSGELFSSPSCDRDIFIRGEGVRPVIDIFSRGGERLHLKVTELSFERPVSDSSLMWPS